MVTFVPQFLKICLYLYILMYVSMCICACMSAGVHKGQKMALGSMKLRLQYTMKPQAHLSMNLNL